MRVVAIHAHGGPEQLKLESWPDPVPTPGQALVEVRACGLNHLDVFVLRGMPGQQVEMPRIPGGDIAGVVRAVGSDADGGWTGQRVLVDPLIKKGRRLGALGEDYNGGLCELIAVDADNLVALPDDVTFEIAATLPIAYGTAHRMMLGRGRVAPGELVLILGASGGVGTACVQLAKSAGATVIACANSRAKLDRLAALGADHLIDYGEEDFSAAAWRISGRKGVDVVVNYTGGETWVPSLRALAPGGRLFTCGATAGFDPRTDIRYIWTREATIVGTNGWRRRDIESLLAMVRDGRIEPVIERVLPLERAGEGIGLLMSRQVFGKVLVTP